MNVSERFSLRDISVFLSLVLVGVLFFSYIGSAKRAEGVVPETLNQAPQLAAQVEEGELPPLEERIPAPEDLYVVEPSEEVGTYGGVVHTVTTRPTAWGEDTMMTDPANLFKSKSDGSGLRMELAKGLETSENARVHTIHLRPGVRWSDGVPFTADDILFWYEHVLKNEDLTPVIGPAWKAGGEVVEVVKVDDYTVQFKFAAPKPFFPNRLVHVPPYRPAHYAKQFHIDFVSEEKMEEMLKAEDFDHWYELFTDRVGLWDAYLLGTIPVTNPDAPTLCPYKLIRQTSSRRVYERNPYYWKVDTAGNQLPYIDGIETTVVTDREVLNGKIMSGEVDFAGFETDIRNYPMFKRYETKGGYETILWHSGMASEVIYMVNQTIEEEKLREVFQDVRFRKALSYAINRDEISSSIYFGRAEPRQYTVLEASKYYEPEFAESYTAYDQEKARSLLEEIGLVDRNGDGWRDFPDGKKFTFTLEFYPSETPKTPNVELVAQHWKEVGLDVNSKAVSSELQGQRAPANLMDATIWHGDKASDILFPIGNNLVIPKAPGWDASQWVEWGRWFNTGGEEGAEPPQKVKDVRNWYEQMITEPDEQKRIELGKKILQSQAENLWVIGTVGKAPYPLVADSDLMNVPSDGLWCWDTLWSMSHDPCQFFFEGGVNEE